MTLCLALNLLQGKQTSGQALQFSPNHPTTLFSSPSSIGTQNYVGDSTDIHQHSSTSPAGNAEVNSDVVFKSNGVETPGGSTSSNEFERRQALKRLEEQLSLGDDHVHTVDPLYTQSENLDSLQFLEFSNDIDHLGQSSSVHQRPENSRLERCYGGYVGAQYNADTVDPLYTQNESLDSLQFLVDCTTDTNHLAQPTTLHQRPENNRLERCYGGYVGAQYHSNNLMLEKNDSGTPELYSAGFRLTVYNLASACSSSLVTLSSLFVSL